MPINSALAYFNRVRKHWLWKLVNVIPTQAHLEMKPTHIISSYLRMQPVMAVVPWKTSFRETHGNIGPRPLILAAHTLQNDSVLKRVFIGIKKPNKHKKAVLMLQTLEFIFQIYQS